MNILAELEKYHPDVQKHYHEFDKARAGWARIVEHGTSGARD